MPARTPAPVSFPPVDDATLSASLAALAAAGLDPAWPPAADRAALAASTGWSGAHLAEAVRRAFAPFTPAACRRLVARGRAAARGARAARPAAPAGPVLVLLAGRVPALPAAVLLQALAARRTVTLKPSSAEPVFARLLADLVARAAPALAPAVGLMESASGDPRLAAAVAAAPIVMAYGSDRTLTAVRALRPGRPTLPGAHRESAVLLLADALAQPGAPARLARAIARDAALYDQSGCLSPQVVLVEEGPGAKAEDLAERLHAALLDVAARWAPAAPALADAAAVRLFVEESRLLAGAYGGLALPVRGPVPPAVVLVRGRPARPAPGHRVLQVVPFRGDPDLAALIPDLSGRLQGLATAGDPHRVAAALARATAFTAPYRCAPGRLQSPPAGWPENGIDVVSTLASQFGDSHRYCPPNPLELLTTQDRTNRSQ